MIGIDVVDVERFRRTIIRAPGIVDRFFTTTERGRAQTYADPARHLAGILAAKEAAMKATGAVPAVAFARRVEISHDRAGAPIANLERRSIEVSISHDGGVAVAMALALP